MIETGIFSKTKSITEIDLNEIALIPESYIYDVNQRLIMYKKISNSTSKDNLDDIIIELTNRFGLVPDEVLNLIDLAKMKLKYSKIGIKKINVSKNILSIKISDKAKFDSNKLINFIKKNNDQVSFRKDNTLVYKKDFLNMRDKKIVLTNIINAIS